METPSMTGFRLAPQQRRRWEIQQDDRGLPARVVGALRIEGALDPERLRVAVARVAERHEILRTVYRRLPGMSLPLQMVAELPPVWSGVLDLSANLCDDGSLSSFLDEQARRPVDLEAGPVLEVSLARISDSRHLLALSLPGLSADVASLELLAGEIGRSYAGTTAEEPIQFIDLAEWQNDLLAAPESADAREYWERLDLSALSRVRLVRDGQTAAAVPFAPRTVSELVPEAAVRALDRLAAEGGATLSALLLTACRLLVERMTGAGESVFGVAHDGRRYAELAGAPGLFVRHLPAPGSVDSESTFRDLARQETAALAKARSWQEAFSWPEGTAPGVVPLLFGFFALAEGAAHAGLSWSLAEFRDVPERFEVRFSWVRQGTGLRLDLGFDPELLPAWEARNLALRLIVLLEGAAAEPDRQAGTLEVLSAPERQALRCEVNDTAVACDLPTSLDALFRAQAARTPDRIAVQFGEGQLSYQDLAARAGRLAGLLRHLGVGPERRVGVLMDRSLEMMISLLAVLEAGGAYLPLDPGYPSERLTLMMDEASPEVVLATREVAGRFSLGTSRVVDPMDSRGGESVVRPGPPGDLAYVIFTSGSTGRPKGVMIPHRSIANRLLWMQRRFPLSAEDAVLQKTPISFDASVWELFLPLLAGARLIVAEPGAHRDSAALADLVQVHQVSVLQLVPSQLGAFLAEPKAEKCTTLRRLFCGGEMLTRRLETRLRKVLGGNDLELVNLYGPTECSIDASFRSCGGTAEGDEGAGIPIGRPLDNVALYLVDDRLRPVAPGQGGEVLVGGAGLARGYLGRPDLTAERFIPSPFGAEPGARLYRTGDLGRFLPDLEIELAGRIDHQVKLRGFRIELGEIESALAGHPEVAAAVVTVREGPAGESRLVAYSVRRGEGDSSGDPAVWIASLRTFLQGKLPAHMVPAAFVPLASLPLAPNGKVDRRALPAPDLLSPWGLEVRSAPLTVVEEVIAEIWSDVLAIPRPAAGDNFFDLGGHSLVATQVVSRVREAFRIELPLHGLFSAPTVSAFASAVEAARGAGTRRQAPPILPVPRDGDLPLSFAQARLWFQDHFQPGEATYNIPTSARLSGKLDAGAFRRALNEIVSRHEILRTIYPGEDGRPRQVILSELDLALPVVDLRALPTAKVEIEARRAATSLARTPLALATGPLLRTVLVRLAPEAHVVVCILHHIVSDAWSGGVLMRELARLYAAFLADSPSPLPPLPVQYADFAAWQRQWLGGKEQERLKSYWRRLEGAPGVLSLPADRSRPEVLSNRGASLPFAVPADLADALRALGRREGATLFMTLMSAFQVLLYAETGQLDLVVGTDVANRNRIETEGLIGFFINQLVLRTDLGGNPTFRALLARVREVTLGAYEHQDLPFEQALEIMKPQRTLRHALGFQVKLFLVNTPPARFELPGLTLSPFGIDSGTSRLDLVVALTESADGLTGWINYNLDLFEPETIDRLAERFLELLRHVAERPDDDLVVLAARLAEIKSDQERRSARRRDQAKLDRFKRNRSLPARSREDPAPAGLVGQET